MKLKNITLFRRRANWHAKEGHVKQGTYGRGRVNGKAKFEGCFVGCLAAPHTKKGLTEYLRSALGSGAYVADHQLINLSATTEESQHRGISSQFGITLPLISVIEAFFEIQPSHAEAIDLIPAIARALNEGADISPEDVRNFWDTQFPKHIYTPNYRDNESNWYNLRSDIEEFALRKSGLRSVNIRAYTADFLKWLRAQKPEPVTA